MLEQHLLQLLIMLPTICSHSVQRVVVGTCSKPCYHADQRRPSAMLSIAHTSSLPASSTHSVHPMAHLPPLHSPGERTQTL